MDGFVFLCFVTNNSAVHGTSAIPWLMVKQHCWEGSVAPHVEAGDHVSVVLCDTLVTEWRSRSATHNQNALSENKHLFAIELLSLL